MIGTASFLAPTQSHTLFELLLSHCQQFYVFHRVYCDSRVVQNHYCFHFVFSLYLNFPFIIIPKIKTMKVGSIIAVLIFFILLFFVQNIYNWIFFRGFNNKLGSMIDLKQLFHTYFVQGLTNSEFEHFGGEKCYEEIPFNYHLVVCSFFCLLHLYLTYRWRNHAVDQQKKVKSLAPNLMQKLCIIFGLICLVYTAYRKIVRQEGLFLLNPCHIVLVIQLILMIGDNSSIWMRRLHTAWSGWLFGPLGALLIPHLQGLSALQIIVFFVQHLLVLPFGPLLMARRYGFLKPNFKNQAIAYGSIIVYHFIILVPVCRIFKVNVNFMLCHSPAEPFYPSFGYHYFLLQIFNLNLIGYLLRWVCYFGVKWLTPRPKQITKKQ